VSIKAVPMSLSTKLKLPTIPAARRPRELVYASDDTPPTGALLALTLQHAGTALALIAYVLASAKIAGLDSESTRSMVTATILGMAISTFLQSWGGRLGPGLQIVHIPDPLLVVISGMAVAEFGVGGLVLITFVNGATALGAGVLVPRLRAVLPPTVAGVVVCIAGLSLIPSALEHTTGMNAVGKVDPIDIILGTTTLVVMITLSIWGTNRAKLFALFAGLLAGVVLALLFGRLDGTHALLETPVVGLPSLPTPSFDLDPTVLAAVALLAIMTQLDTFGTSVLVQRMNDADFKRPDMRRVGAAIRANGLGNLLSSFLGAYPSATSSANIALTHISRSTSRVLGITTAVALAIIAFLPQISLALTLIPTPVIGAVEIYAAAYLVVSGIELIASRAIDTRGIFMIGLSFIAGVGVMLLPALAELAPDSLRFLAHNGIIVGGFCAIVLNSLFRLGTSQKVTQTITPTGTGPTTPAQQVTDFIEENGGIWGARRDAVQRAAQAALEAAEALTHATPPRTLLAITASFDEYNLEIELQHDGAALALDTPQSAQANLLELDDAHFEAALNNAMGQVSTQLLRRLADRVSTGTKGQYSVVRLHFDH
jgi:xanthine permease XanP